MALQGRTLAERHAEAQRHVLVGRRLIDRQRRLIGRLKVLGRDTRRSEEILVSFEQTQLIFEGDLIRIGVQRRT